MKTIIAGPRDFLDFQFVKKTIQESGFIITEVVSGCAKGVDWMGEYWAALNGIPVKRFPAQWEYRGKAAGPIRNQVMVDYAKAAIIIVGGRGSRDCWMKAKKGKNRTICCWYGRRDSNSHERQAQEILSLQCLPFHHVRISITPS